MKKSKEELRMVIMKRLSEAIDKGGGLVGSAQDLSVSKLEEPLLKQVERKMQGVMGHAENQKPVQAPGSPVCGQRMIHREGGYLTDTLRFAMMLSFPITITVTARWV